MKPATTTSRCFRAACAHDAEDGTNTAAGPTRNRAGFSLLEMIGVLAIVAIMASMIVPNVLRSLDRAAIRAEESNLDALGEQLKLYLRDTTFLPTSAVPNAMPNWTTQLSQYADLSPGDIHRNRRGNIRIFILEPVIAPAVPRRAIFLSSMRQGFGLPAATTFDQTRFNLLWDTLDGNLPANTVWAGFGAAPWSTTQGAAEYLLIQRVNLAGVYAAHLQVVTVTLNNISAAGGGGGGGGGGGNNGGGNGGGNNGGGNGNGNNGNGNGNGGSGGSGGGSGGGGSGVVARYAVIDANGANGPSGSVQPNIPVTLTLRTGDRLELQDSGSNTLYTFMVGNTDQTFNFDGFQWLPQ